MAWEWLIGSHDHFLGYFEHNYFWYQQPNKKWVYIPYDFGETTFGSVPKLLYYPKINKKEKTVDIDIAYISFKDFELDHPIIKILIHNDDNTFRNLLGDIISKIFNPDTLLLHIEKLKTLISPFIEKDRKYNAGKIK